MVKVVGSVDRSEFILDPTEAWRRGRALDRLLAGATPAPRRGVQRGTHRSFNEIDDRRALERARVLNASPGETARPSP